MATNHLPVQAIGVRATVSGHRTTRVGATASWWSPLFGISDEPDYIDSDKNEDAAKSESKQARSKFTPGCFTAEKAKQLRMMTKETASFHDVMYHSAIATRLASDFFRRNDQ